ncbi:hypothetical protein Hanom_Chr06g00522411 [Helianthus anomalus]
MGGERVCLRMLHNFYIFTWIDRGFLLLTGLSRADWRIHKEAPLRLKLLDFLWFCQSTSSDATILLSMVTILA